MNDKQILISDDLYMMVRALEFFVDYKFSTGTWMQQEYIRRMKEIDHNEYAVLCKRMGGKTRFEPVSGSGTPVTNDKSPATLDEIEASIYEPEEEGVRRGRETAEYIKKLNEKEKTTSEKMQDNLEPIPCPMHEDYDENENATTK